MATTIKTEKIFIGIDNQVFELTGVDKEAFLAERDAREAQRFLLEAIALEKDKARASALTKLGEIAGLTKEELDAIL
jgi:S-adenosylmethionine:diacylglycerol 3-amino-3-carboxypropyl transferase